MSPTIGISKTYLQSHIIESALMSDVSKYGIILAIITKYRFTGVLKSNSIVPNSFSLAIDKEVMSEETSIIINAIKPGRVIYLPSRLGL